MTEQSAYKIMSKLHDLGKSVIYTKNKNGVKTLSCTPQTKDLKKSANYYS